MCLLKGEDLFFPSSLSLSSLSPSLSLSPYAFLHLCPHFTLSLHSFHCIFFSSFLPPLPHLIPLSFINGIMAVCCWAVWISATSYISPLSAVGSFSSHRPLGCCPQADDPSPHNTHTR